VIYDFRFTNYDLSGGKNQPLALVGVVTNKQEYFVALNNAGG